jgi:hypothetical protein
MIIVGVTTTTSVTKTLYRLRILNLPTTLPLTLLRYLHHPTTVELVIGSSSSTIQRMIIIMMMILPTGKRIPLRQYQQQQ